MNNFSAAITIDEHLSPSLQVGLASSLPLNVMVFHSAVAAHQDNAVLILQLLKELSEKSGN